MKIEILDSSNSINELMNIVCSYDYSLIELEQHKKTLSSELLEKGDNRTFFIGKIELNPVVMVQLIHKNADKDPALANGEDISHVHGLRVKKDFARRGLSKKMMSFIEDYAKKHGQTELTLGVDDWNNPALRLYSSLGYQKFKEEPGRTHEEVLFLLKKKI